MRGNKAFVAVAVTTALSVLGTASASAGSDRRPRIGFVMPCSLDGVNPVFHPGIFGNPAVARAYGFVQSPNGTWHVQNNCVRGLTVPY
jgi:hypothetical protein